MTLLAFVGFLGFVLPSSRLWKTKGFFERGRAGYQKLLEVPWCMESGAALHVCNIGLILSSGIHNVL